MVQILHVGKLRRMEVGTMDRNIVWQSTKVSREDRERILNQKGIVIWFTGLSGSGKSTIAVSLEKCLNEMGMAAYLLDGDNIRHGINSDLGFSDQDRNENIRRITEIAALFADAGIVTLVSFISPFRQMRQLAREKLGTARFLEVYVKADLETCRKRDPKGLYKKQIQQFTGVSSGYEEPISPELILDTEKLTVEQCVEEVLSILKKAENA